MRAVVFGGPGHLAARTQASLERVGLRAVRAPSLEAALADATPGWLVRAGAWFQRTRPPRPPPPSATGRPLLALGAVVGEPSSLHRAWADALGSTGGSFEHGTPLPPIASAWLDARAAEVLAREGLGSRGLRVVRWPELDVAWAEGLRVLQLTTSLQQGGAERLVLDLDAGLRARDVATALVTIGRPTREPFPAPRHALDLAELRGRPEQLDAIVQAAQRFGPDVTHAHLVEGPVLEALGERGLRVIVTAHNARAGWPPGLESTRAPLVIACSTAVHADLRAAGRPARTIRNAVDPTRLGGASLRPSLGIPAEAIVLIAVANPRPQKRLHLLPPIARALADRTGRAVHLVLAGSVSRVHADAAEAMALLTRAAEASRVPLHALGAVREVGAVYRTGDVLVSTSGWEGLSLAQLEALALGVPVVATDAGGARELPGVVVVPVDAPPSEFVRAIEGALGARPELGPAWQTPALVDRHVTLYRRVVAAAEPADGVLLVTNNFSTGGAQSSARRLLLGLRARGVAVRAAVVEEQATCPTPGRAALEAAGIPVLAAPPDARAAAEAIARAVDDAPPRAVLFWNLSPEHKVRLADLLVGRRVLDVSPGEMFFASLARLFARPLADLPYASARDYGRLLDRVVVKYAAEAPRAAEALGLEALVIPNGVPERALAPRRPADHLRLLTAARLAPHKRLLDLVAALRLAHAALPPWTLRIVGGPERGSEDHVAELRAAIAGLPITLVGEQVPVDLDETDAFLQVSEPAGCPNASLEAMAAGLPVVATDVGGASEQVLDGETGLLVPRRDAAAFAAALARLTALDLPAMGRRAQAHVRAHFGLDGMVDRYARACGLEPMSDKDATVRERAR